MREGGREGKKRLPNSHSVFTFPMTAAMNERRGSMVATTRASFQLMVKATMKPDMKVVKYCRKTATLSPMPALIFSMSLWVGG